jgi:hypothetical protein
VLVKKQNIGSKSEGFYTFLISEQMDAIYRLYQKDVFNMNDESLMSFDRKDVKIIGEIQQDKWLMVNSIEELN